MRVAILTFTAAAALVAGRPALTEPSPFDGSWIGSYTQLRSSPFSLTVKGKRAELALGPGHASLRPVRATFARGRLTVVVPGRPAPLRFDLRQTGDGLTGSVTQGALRGAAGATRGTSSELTARGSFIRASRELDVVDDPYGPARLLDPVSGVVHSLHPAGEAAFSVGRGFATDRPVLGTARLGAEGGRVLGAAVRRVRLEQLEVRIPTPDGTTLGGTLTIPRGPGPHAAIAYVTGSGETDRSYLPDLQAMLVHAGVAVLAYDKRGVGQSGGRYPGESPSDAVIDVLARDAAAAVRFLARQPNIDRSRVGLAGHSQAGWIMPLAASRERAVRFLVALSGPSVTTGEVDLFQNLTGQGVQRLHSVEDATREVVAQGPSGIDPLPWIRSLEIPSLWLYGALDQHVPSALSTERLRTLDDARVTVESFPRANHALVETRTGQTAEMVASDRFARGLPGALRRWLAAHGLT